VTLVFRRPIRVPGGVNSKLVGKLKPLLGVIGKPDRARSVPDICQSPSTACRALPAPLKNRCPRPKGSAVIQYALKLCRRSKSERARLALGSSGFAICPFNENRPDCENRSAFSGADPFIN